MRPGHKENQTKHNEDLEERVGKCVEGRPKGGGEHGKNGSRLSDHGKKKKGSG